MALLIRNARVLTLAGPRPRRGRSLADLAILNKADVYIDGDRITSINPKSEIRDPQSEIDARGRVLLPAFIDCHTHTCFAGSRIDEWEMKLKGAAYLDILKAGGGIMSTVRATRAASESELTQLISTRLRAMAHAGTATVEIKSGYGLTQEHELRMLRAIRTAADTSTPQVFSTALLGHAVDQEVPDFLKRTIAETLPAVSREFPGIPVDAFCEQAAWSLNDTIALLTAAKKLGHPIRVHADQFNSLGMIPKAIELGARSVDHLEATTPEDAQRLAASDTFGVILPCCGFHLDGRYASGRRVIDAGGLLAIATNFNPGSAPCYSMPMAIALAVRHCRLTPYEAIAAATVNPAEVLGLSDRGQIAPGQRADLVLLNHTDERALAYEFGSDPIHTVIISGRVARGAA